MSKVKGVFRYRYDEDFFSVNVDKDWLTNTSTYTYEINGDPCKYTTATDATERFSHRWNMYLPWEFVS